jgi:putative flippase GtrA
MRKHIHNARDLLLPIIDFFYPPFRRIVNIQTFRYAVSGAANTALGFVVFYTSFKYLFAGENIDLGFYIFTPYTVALVLSFSISFPVGFFLSKYVVFSDSKIKGRIQLFRYFMICMFNLALNYILLKIFVEKLHIYPTIAQVLTIGIVILFSYLAQRHFSFKAGAAENEITS